MFLKKGTRDLVDSANQTQNAESNKNSPSLSTSGARGWVKTPSLQDSAKQNLRGNLLIFLDSATRTPLTSLDSFAKRAAPPAPLPLRAKKLLFFAFRGRASLSPLLAKNQRSHYCSLAPDFLHHEAGEFSGASHEFNADSANSQNLVKNNLARSANLCKSFCSVWLLPNEESPLSFNYNLPNKVVSQNLPKSQLKG